METEKLIQFEIQGFGPGESDDAEKFAKVVESEGGEASVQNSSPGDNFQFAFIPIVVGAVAVVGLAHAIKNLIDDFRCAVIIDARDGKVITTKDSNLPPGTVSRVDAGARLPSAG